MWLWRDGQGWCWTGKDIYPWLYCQKTAGWMYFLTNSNGKAYFFNQASGEVK
jgi:hypothetical protein